MRKFESLALLKSILHTRNQYKYTHPSGAVGFKSRELMHWYKYYERWDGWVKSGSTKGELGAEKVLWRVADHI